MKDDNLKLCERIETLEKTIDLKVEEMRMNTFEVKQIMEKLEEVENKLKSYLTGNSNTILDDTNHRSDVIVNKKFFHVTSVSL